MTRARAIYRAAYHWVTCKPEERGTFATLMGQAAREWRDEDREKGIPPPPMPREFAEAQEVKRINDRIIGRR